MFSKVETWRQGSIWKDIRLVVVVQFPPEFLDVSSEASRDLDANRSILAFQKKGRKKG